MNVPKHWRENPRRYRMEAAKCKKCGKITFPGRLICPDCGHTEHELMKLTGKGKLETFTIGLVELDEGVKVLGQLTDCDPESLKTGDRLTSKFRRMNEEGKTGMIMYSYKFVPDQGL